MGTVWISVPAHFQTTRFNELARLGTVGTVFHACCLLETTTNAFHIGMLPNSPTGCGSWDRRRTTGTASATHMRRPRLSACWEGRRWRYEGGHAGRARLGLRQLRRKRLRPYGRTYQSDGGVRAIARGVGSQPGRKIGCHGMTGAFTGKAGPRVSVSAPGPQPRARVATDNG